MSNTAPSSSNSQGRSDGTTITCVADFERTLKCKGYTDLGCYPVFYITSDGEAMSFESAWQNKEHIAGCIIEKSDCGMRVVAVAINWEDTSLQCCVSGKPIPSAYCD